MPHVIIEYAQDLADDVQVHALLEVVYSAIAASELFEEENIKVRAIPVKYYLLGKDKQGFIHAHLRIHTGRSTEQKKFLSQAVLVAIRDQGWSADVITVEVVDMDKHSYAKYTD